MFTRFPLALPLLEIMEGPFSDLQARTPSAFPVWDRPCLPPIPFLDLAIAIYLVKGKIPGMTWWPRRKRPVSFLCCIYPQWETEMVHADTHREEGSCTT